MKKLFLILSLFIGFALQAQIPVYNPQGLALPRFEVAPTIEYEGQLYFKPSTKEVFISKDAAWEVFGEVNITYVATENTTATGTVNLDLSTFATTELTLTGNTTITVTNTPTVNTTFVRTLGIASTATETITLPVSWNVYGTYVADGTRNKLSIEFTNTTTGGLVIDCFINQPD